ncbi:MAG TPA: hemolysin family protein [Nitrospinota bacterium]|nr:hemolysin family protein [Nitrospinota bacterium]
MIDFSLLIRFFILIVFLIMSAFFAACEVSFFSLTKARVDTMKEKGRMGASIIAYLLEKPSKLLITIYLGNDFVNVAISAIVTSICIHIFGDVGISIAIGIATFLLIVFGDIAPKTFAIKNNEKVALFSAYPLKIFYILVSPIQKIFSVIANRAISILGGKRFDEETVITEEEIRTLIDVGEDEGTIKSDEKEMIQSVFELGDTRVEDIMTRREDIFSIDVNTDIRNAITSSYYSRIPVYDGNIDNIAGILYLKDLMKYTYPEQILPKLKNILHPPFIVSGKKRVNELLKEFQKKKVHMAIVLDEHSRVEGLVTMEDVLIELVGEF